MNNNNLQSREVICDPLDAPWLSIGNIRSLHQAAGEIQHTAKFRTFFIDRVNAGIVYIHRGDPPAGVNRNTIESHVTKSTLNLPDSSRNINTVDTRKGNGKPARVLVTEFSDVIIGNNTVPGLPSHQDSFVNAGIIHFLQENLNGFPDHGLRAGVSAYQRTAFY
jgi:hypothetical protein